MKIEYFHASKLSVHHIRDLEVGWEEKVESFAARLHEALVRGDVGTNRA